MDTFTKHPSRLSFEVGGLLLLLFSGRFALCVDFNRASFDATTSCPCSKSETPSLAITCDSKPSPFMEYTEQLLMSQCDLRDPMHCYTSDLKTESVDFIVVGAGSAGCVVTSRLSEVDHWQVTLLEAGGPAPAATQVPAMYFNYQGSAIDWNYPIEKQAHSCLSRPGGVCRYPRGKVMGGTSVLHGNMYMRGNSKDYEDITASGVLGWTWDEVLPYFKKSENNMDFDQIKEYKGSEKYHSKGGYLTVSRYPEQPDTIDYFMGAAAELGYAIMGDPNGGNQTGFTVAQMTVSDGERLTTSKAFLYPAEVLSRPNLNIITRAQVLKVLFDKSNRAIGVVYRREGGQVKRLLAKKEVILSAGAIASPHLLLLSGVGPKDHLARKGVPLMAHLPGVGQSLHNHISISIPIVLTKLESYNRLNVSALSDYIINRKGPLTSTAMSQVTGFAHLNESNSSQWPDTQFFFEGLMANCSKTGFNRQDHLHPQVVRMVPTLLRPLSKGFIELYSSNALAYPRIVSNYLTHSDDVELLLKGVRFVQRVISTKSLREQGAELSYEYVNSTAVPCTVLPVDSDEYWRCVIRHVTNPENHQVATCKMGSSSDELAVVNERLQVNRVSNLRVIDASVIPFVISGNINAVVIMVAEKGADMIKEHWLGSADFDGKSNIFQTIFNKRPQAPNFPFLRHIPPDYGYFR